MEQLSLFSPFPTPYSLPPITYDPYWDEITKEVDETVGEQLQELDTVGEQVQNNTQKVAPQQCHWLEKYWVERHNKKYYYWRYCWMEGRKINRCYIGAVGSARALKKYNAVAVAIEDKKSPIEIKHLLNPSLGKGGRGEVRS